MSEETPGRLRGLRIAVTREAPGELAALLRAQGAEVIHCPLIRVVAGPDDLRAALERDHNWVVFTSANALRFTLAAGGDLPPRIACVGESTAEAARRHGLAVNLVPERQHVKGLIEAFAGQPPGRVLYPRSEVAPSTLREGLQALGFTVDDPVAYRTLPDEGGMKQLVALVSQGGLRAVAFASPSAVHNAVSAVGDALGKLHLYSIGPSTSAALREHELKVAGEASEHSAAGLARVISEGGSVS